MSRLAKKNRLLIRVDGKWSFSEEFPTYVAAVIAGQQRGGKGNFTIETGNRTPSREEQLLQKGSKRQDILKML